MSIIRGIANRNPFNIKSGPKPWDGENGVDDLGHAIFPDPIYSVRAAIRQLYKYQIRDNLHTLTAIFAKYAPLDDPNATNEPSVYAKFVADRVGIEPDMDLTLFNPDGEVIMPMRLIQILQAILEYEIFSGYKLPIETLEAGIAYYERDFT